MEKFGKWRDKESGVGPFLPRTRPEPTFVTALRWIFGIIKLPIFFVNLLLSWTFVSLFRLFPIHFIGRIFERFFNFCFQLQSLILFGQFYTPTALTPLVKKIVEGSWKKPSHGDLVITHLTSYLNLIWLQFKLAPTFMVPVSADECVTFSLQSLLIYLFRHKDLRTKGKPKKIQSVINSSRRKKQGPIVVLAEGAPTNGEGLLKFQCFNAKINEKTKIQVLGFVREFRGCSPNMTCTNGIAHVIRQLGKFYTKCEVKIALDSDVGRPKDDMITEEFIEKERNVLSRLIKLPTTELDANSYNEFMEAYKHRKLHRADKED